MLAIMLTVAALSFVLAVLTGRWAALWLPVGVVAAVVAIQPSDWAYERMPEEHQFALMVGGVLGVLTGAAGVMVRRLSAARRPPARRAGARRPARGRPR